MKQKFLIILFFGFSISIFGQTTLDKQKVIQMSIDLDDLQQYYYPTKMFVKKNHLIICNNGVISDKFSLTKFGNPVLFRLKVDLFMMGTLDYLVFNTFDIDENNAMVSFRYLKEGIRVELTFKKVNNQWIIKSSELVETSNRE